MCGLERIAGEKESGRRKGVTPANESDAKKAHMPHDDDEGTRYLHRVESTAGVCVEAGCDSHRSAR